MLVPFRERMTFGYVRALKLGNASQVAPSDKLSVVLVAGFAVVFLARSWRRTTGWELPPWAAEPYW